MKNRMPEIGATGSVRGEGGNILTYSAKLLRPKPVVVSVAETPGQDPGRHG